MADLFTAKHLVAAIIIGFVTMGIDVLFHGFLTSPFELPAYFLSKFVFGFTAGMLIPFFDQNDEPDRGAIGAAFIFTAVLVDGYYGIGVYLLQIPGLSSSPTGIIAILGYMNQFALVGIWTLVHGLFFFAAYLLPRFARLYE